MYAYGSSGLQAALLRLFVRCECVLPDLFVGTLTRESVIGALRRGLRAEDVINYLRSRAHPKIAARSPVVPEARAAAFHASLRAHCSAALVTAAVCALMNGEGATIL